MHAKPASWVPSRNQAKPAPGHKHTHTARDLRHCQPEALLVTRTITLPVHCHYAHPLAASILSTAGGGEKKRGKTGTGSNHTTSGLFSLALRSCRGGTCRLYAVPAGGHDSGCTDTDVCDVLCAASGIWPVSGTCAALRPLQL